jgi:predicted RNA-binding Zn-ribbon protein involved in translation (DUF1610 family)
MQDDSTTEKRQPGSLHPAGSASVLELGYAKSNDAHCLACGFRMVGGAYVGLCPKCGSDRWYKTRLTPNDQAEAQCPGEKGKNATKPN